MTAGIPELGSLIRLEATKGLLMYIGIGTGLLILIVLVVVLS